MARGTADLGGETERTTERQTVLFSTVPSLPHPRCYLGWQLWFLLLFCLILSMWEQLYHYESRRILAVKCIDPLKYTDLRKFANPIRSLSSCARFSLPVSAPPLSTSPHPALCPGGHLCELSQCAPSLVGFWFGWTGEKHWLEESFEYLFPRLPPCWAVVDQWLHSLADYR